ncbi:MAG: mannosyltransferase family protein [Acidobacteriota bacterium]
MARLLQPTIRLAQALQASSGAAMLRVWIAFILDVLIALYAAALVIAFVTGGLDLGWLSIRQAAKPVLVLWILVPIRLAFGQPWWLRTVHGQQLWSTARESVRLGMSRLPSSVQDAAFALIVTRLATVAVGFLVNLLYPGNRARPFELPFAVPTLAETFAAWDSGWYFDIAQRGYYYTADGQSSVPFFPLYPMMMRAVAWPLDSSERAIWGAGIAISIVAFFFGLIALHQLTERVFADREVARRTVLYVAVFPFSFFMSRVYPTSLFFLLAVLSVSAAYRSRWWLAGFCGALATLTRPHGILIGVPLVLMAFGHGGGRDALKRLGPLLLIPTALATYSLYVWSLAGHPLAWLTAQNQWGFTLGHPPWEQLLSVLARLERYGPYDYFFTSQFAAFRLFHAGAALFLLAMTPSVFRRLGAPLGLWVVLSVVVPLSGNALEGIGRYGAVLFPVFMVLGATSSARAHEALLIMWSLFLALFVGLFVTWQPIY